MSFSLDFKVWYKTYLLDNGFRVVLLVERNIPPSDLKGGCGTAISLLWSASAR